MDPHAPQDPPPVSLRATERHLLPRDGVTGDVELRIARPLPPFTGGPAPDPEAVLYLLDGDLYFGTATETTRLLNQFMGELPPILVVGVGYGVEDSALQAELRTRDCTPSKSGELGAMAGSWGREPALPEGERMGGADDFLDLLEREVRPFVEARFPVAGAPAVLFGSSLGGLLGAWALVTRPALFDAWILVSPSLWWDDGVALRREREAAAAGTPVSGRVYLGVGSREEGTGIPHLDDFRLVSNTRLLGERLRARIADGTGHGAGEGASGVGAPSPGTTARGGPTGTAVTVEVLDGETHTSVVPRALLTGLRAVLPPSPLPTGP
jgi:hypothetical protein